MVDLGRANSLMKDFYDIWLLAKSFRFEDDRLARAIAATFARRMTPLSVELPDALSTEFAADPAKITCSIFEIGSSCSSPGSAQGGIIGGIFDGFLNKNCFISIR
ncbi:MAG TPA: nucleotidyl transferase AbiEii/AbiGii toxin family protein [Sphingomonadaceae bacterium]